MISQLIVPLLGIFNSHPKTKQYWYMDIKDENYRFAVRESIHRWCEAIASMLGVFAGIVIYLSPSEYQVQSIVVVMTFSFMILWINHYMGAKVQAYMDKWLNLQ